MLRFQKQISQTILGDQRSKVSLVYSVSAFSETVLVALFTMKIRNLWQHLSAARKDKGNLRHLQRLVHRRAKMLKYLKRVDYERWRTCLDRLGLESEAVEGELNVTVR